MKAIILAGGGGTRLWPLSREDFPKQFLNFGSGLSLLQKTVQRLRKAPFLDQVLVATNAHHLSLVQEQLRKIGDRVQILVEPSRRNTAPAIGLAVKYLQEFCQLDAQEPILVLPSDHLIEPEAIFLEALEQMEEMARNRWIVTFGIRPTCAETGYGYIQIGEKNGPFTFEAARFVEKPDRLTAESYLKDPRFYWNSGMFLFSAKTFWHQLNTHCESLSLLLSGRFEDCVARFDQMAELSIDYAIMEKSKEISVCPLAVQWSDVGSWDSVYETMEKDGNQNVKVGQVFDIDTKNSLIISGKRLVSTIGIEDLLIVETEDALFVSRKGESQRVKGLVQQLLQKGRKERTEHAFQSHAWGSSHLLDENEDYSVRKFQLNPGQKMKCAGQVFALRGDLVYEEDFIVNQTCEAIEFLAVVLYRSESLKNARGGARD